MIFHTKRYHLYRLPPGVDLLRAVVDLCRQQAITTAWISGLGAVRTPTIGAYDFATGQYHRLTLEGDWELLVLNGNLTPAEGVEGPFAHLHVLLGDHHGQVRGGHLFAAEVLVAEIGVHVLEGARVLRRVPQPNGLLLWPTIEEEDL